LFDIVHVGVVTNRNRNSTKNSLHVHVTLYKRNGVKSDVDETFAGGEGGAGEELAGGVEESVLDGKVTVTGVLSVRVDPSVSDGKTLQVDLGVNSLLIFLENSVRNGGDIVTGIGLSCDVEGEFGVLRVYFEKVLQKLVHVTGDLILVHIVVQHSLAVRETGTDGLIYIDDTAEGVPAVRVDLQIEVFINSVRSVLIEKGDFRRAARASGEPDDKRVGLGVASRFKHPIENVRLVAKSSVDGDVTGMLSRIVGTDFSLYRFGRSIDRSSEGVRHAQ